MQAEQSTQAGITKPEKFLFIAGVIAGVAALAFTLVRATGGTIPAFGAGVLP